VIQLKIWNWQIGELGSGEIGELGNGSWGIGALRNW